MLEGNDDEALAYAGAGGFMIFAGAILLREIIFRNARRRFLEAQKQLDFNTDRISKNQPQTAVNKISLEQNSAIIKNIKEKSRAAKVLANLPDVHREVFLICNEYLLLTAGQIKNAGPGSPRLAAFKSGRQLVKELHRFHLLEYIEAETRNLSRKSNNSDTISERINIAGQALELLSSGLQYYPNESRLTDSQQFLRQYISVSKVLEKVGEAEQASESGDYKSALDFYRNALLILEEISAETVEKEELAEKINKEINKIYLQDQKKNENFSTVPLILNDKYD